MKESLSKDGYLLQKLTGKLSSLRLLFFDTESTNAENKIGQGKQYYKFGTAIYIETDNQGNKIKEKKYMAHSPEKLLEILEVHLLKKSELHVLSCNIWFDLRISGILTQLCNKGYVVDKFHIKGLCVIIRMSRDKQKIIFSNINQYLPGSVSQYGMILGLPKIDIDLNNCNIIEMQNYCMRDTEIITEMYLKYLQFIAKQELGRLGFTIASQSFISFRSKFMMHHIYIHKNDDIKLLERDAYYGGRTEAFYIGKVPEEKIYCLDINSMYPYIMKHIQLPYKFVYAYENIPINELEELISKYFCVAQVGIYIEENKFPLRNEGKTVFPIGRFVASYCGHELENAYKNNNILKIYNIACYEKTILFQHFVDYFYQLRLKYISQDNAVMQYLCKILLNSLYGKFGQKMDLVIKETQEKNVEYYSEYGFDLESQRHIKTTKLGTCKKIYIESVNEADFSFPAISAGVTSAARMYLYDFIIKAGKQNVYYVDTDSLYVNEVGYKKLQQDIDNKKLGKLKLEKSINEFIIFGAKDYVVDGISKIKGIPKLATKIDENTYETTVFPGFKSDIHGNINMEYEIEKRLKKLSRVYSKGVVDGRGYVQPLRINEW